jgi:hypothetical protein
MVWNQKRTTALITANPSGSVFAKTFNNSIEIENEIGASAIPCAIDGGLGETIFYRFLAPEPSNIQDGEDIRVGRKSIENSKKEI